MISERKLNRTNNRALVFVGEEIASATNRIKDSTRWDKVHVYKSTSGRYIVGIAQITYWDGERDHYIAESFGTMDEAIAFVERNENARPLAHQVRRQLND